MISEIKGYIRDKNQFEKKCEAAYSYCIEKNIEYNILYLKDIEKLENNLS